MLWNVSHIVEKHKHTVFPQEKLSVQTPEYTNESQWFNFSTRCRLTKQLTRFPSKQFLALQFHSNGYFTFFDSAHLLFFSVAVFIRRSIVWRAFFSIFFLNNFPHNMQNVLNSFINYNYFFKFCLLRNKLFRPRYEKYKYDFSSTTSFLFHLNSLETYRF